jgi:transcriptional regulator with XRE-family HTH domain
MKSPFTGNDSYLTIEERTLEYRKEPFHVLYSFYICEDTNEQFTTTELDVANLNQVYNQYRVKYGIPFTDEIKSLRTYYGLSAAKMSEVLGLGANVYRGYEAGEMPSIANGRLIQLAKDPMEFKKLLFLCKNEFEEHDYDRVFKKIEHSRTGWSLSEQIFDEKVLGPRTPSVYNGYKIPDWDKVGYMVQFFAKRMTPFTTMLNKLMFYTDFLHYRRTSYGITGVTYKAIQMGPVPNNYGSLYDDVIEKRFANVRVVEFGEYEGEQFYTDGTTELEYKDMFSESEIKAMEDVANTFKNHKTRHIIGTSHEEHAWQVNVDQFNRIKYDFGFFLKNIE